MIRVIIERIIASGLEANYTEASENTLKRAFSASGFISGKSMTDLNRPNHRVILCKWRSVDDWNRWHNSKERKQLMNELTPLLLQEEKITLVRADDER